jgi:sugar lactone lactonase YvrE
MRNVTLLAGSGPEPWPITVDGAGFIWVAIWGAGAVHRYRPDGELDRKIALPVTQITSIVFGGSDYRDLYITTARQGLTPERLEQEPLAGSTFVCQPGVRGVASYTFAG